MFHAQAAWIMLRTPLKPRFWSTFVRNSQTVQRFSSVPMLMRIAAQAAAIRAALLQNAKQSNDFSHFLNPETLLATSKCPCHNRCTLCRDSAPTALIHSPCAMISLPRAPNRPSRPPQEAPQETTRAPKNPLRAPKILQRTSYSS